MNLTRKLERFTPACRQAGLSLVELMISLTIGLVLLAGITTLIVQQSGTRREMEKASSQIENGRYAIEILHDDIEHAGFYGEYAVPITAQYQVPADPCSTGPGVAQGWNAASSPVAIPVPVQGYGWADAAPACVTNRKPATAALVVRRTATPTDTIAASGVTYLQVSRCNTDADPFLLAQGAFILRQRDCATPAPLHGYIVRIYYISSCSVVCGAAGDGIPTLKMVEFANGAQTVIPLVEGIENMNFDYGIDTNNDGAPDSYTATPAAADWANVTAVRVSLLARNSETTPGYTDSKAYSLGSSAVAAASDSFKRHVYSQLVRVVNASGRREQP